MELGFSKWGTFLAICFACFSVFFYFKFSDPALQIDESNYERTIIDSWRKTVQPPQNQFKKLAVGVNSNIDVIVNGIELLTALGMSPGKGKDHSVVNNVGHLQESFSHFFSRGSAAERAFSDPSEYQHILQTAMNVNSIEYNIGGNAALMAKTASQLFPNAKIEFIGPVGPLLESLFPKSIEIPASCKLPQDEMHLIMEFKVGEKWGDLTAPVATRFIATYDEHNSKISMIETFFESIKTYKPDLILLSGLNIMDGLTPDVFHERLNKMIPLVKEVPSSMPVHLELASMANTDFVHTIMDKVVSHVDSLGLNEQELAFSAELSGGPHSGPDLHGPNGQPIIHKISDIMLWLLQTYGKSTKQPHAKLTRVHFHSLTYHIVAVSEASGWDSIGGGVTAGTQVAGLQACDVDSLHEDMVELKIPRKFKLFSGDEEREFDPSQPLIQWRRDGYLFAFSPVLVCKKPVRTVGLGDAISATGLMFSSFKS